MAAAVAPALHDVSEMPQLDRGRRQAEAFDVDELIRRLEAYRLEMKMANVRRKSQQLKDMRSSILTYQPRYTARLSTNGAAEISRPFSAEKSKRSSRHWDHDKSDRSDRSYKSDEDSERYDSGRSSQWVNPKHMRSASDLDALNAVNVQHPPPDLDEVAQAKKKANRGSFAFLEAGIARLKSQSSSHSLRSLRPVSRAADTTTAPPSRHATISEPGRCSRPLSTAFEDHQSSELHFFVPPVPKIRPPSPQKLTAVQEAKQNRRRSWRPPPADLGNWTQPSQSSLHDHAGREAMLTQMARRKSRTTARPNTSAADSRPPSKATLSAGPTNHTKPPPSTYTSRVDNECHQKGKEKDPVKGLRGFLHLFKRLR